MDALCMCGDLDLTRYIRLWNDDAPLPPMKAMGYLAPPWLIGTYPHWDGAGAQLSLHTYAFGPGHQLIHLYPTLSRVQEATFLKVCALPGIYALPHDPDMGRARWTWTRRVLGPPAPDAPRAIRCCAGDDSPGRRANHCVDPGSCTCFQEVPIRRMSETTPLPLLATS